MGTLGAYFAPLLLINGVGLILLSTASRYMNVKAEIQKLTPEDCAKKKEELGREIKRAHLFHRAMVGLYLSIGFFSSSALIGTLIKNYPQVADFILNSFTIAGVACTVFASFQLIVESFLTMEIVKKHADKK